MARKSKQKKINPAQKCSCNKCGVQAHSIPQTQHRNCGGEMGANPKDPANRLVGGLRGTWQ